jgi:hypothetical protein
MLDDPHPRQVAGDDSGRIFRRCSPVKAVLEGNRSRIVEGYHWGRYTAGSPSRALWLLLLPFSLINLARFALLMPHRRRRRDRVADAVLRLLGLALTGTLVVTACYIGWEVAARQCAATACAADNGWLRWFVDRSYGVRILVGALVPAAVVLLVWSFGRQSFTYDPPGAKREWRKDTNGSFDDPGFWRGAAQASRQRAAHVWFSCAVLGGLALGTLGSPGRWWDGWPSALQGLYIGLLALTAAGGGTAVVIVIWDPHPNLQEMEPDPSGRDTIRVPGWMSVLRWAMAVVAAFCVLLAGAGVDRDPPNLAGASTVFEVAVNTSGVLAWLLLLALLVVCAVLAFGKPGRRLRGKDLDRPMPPPDPDSAGADRAGWRYPAVPAAFRPFWRGFGAWVIAALGVTVAFGFSTVAVFWSAKLLGRPVIDVAANPAVQARDQQIELAEGYWAAAVIWGGLAVLAAVAVVPVAAWLLARRWALVLPLVLAAAGVGGWASVRYDGDDRLSDQAEYYLIAAGLVAAAVGLAVWRSDEFNRLVTDDYPGEGNEIRRGGAAVARLWRLAMIRYRYYGVAGAVAVLGGLGITAWAAAGGLVLAGAMAGSPAAPRVVTGAASSVVGAIGVAVVSALATGLIVLGLATWRTQRTRTTVGILWDLLSFWPRVAHPLCPPPYGGRAVLAVADRCSQLVNDRHAGAVVLSGHSQGSVITMAACAVLDEQARNGTDQARAGGDWLGRTNSAHTIRSLHMVTYGSQLQFIYPRVFPSYLGYFRLKWIYDKALEGRWRSLYRWTDPLGGPVLSWPHAGTTDRPAYGPQVRKWTFVSCADPATCLGHEPCVQPDDGPGGEQPDYRYWVLGPDVRLRDPAVVVESPRQPRLPARGHSDYPADRVFDEVVAQLAAGTVRLPPTCPPAG